MRRVCLQAVPPRADAGEITEKGYINQSRTQDLRAGDVERLFEGECPNDILEI